MPSEPPRRGILRGAAAPRHAVFLGLCAAAVCRGEIVFPDDPAVMNAKTRLGAVGDGKTDDTAALQAGLDASCRSRDGSRILYLPNGVYRVTRTLVVPHGVGPWVYGQSRDGVVIRMDDGAASTSVTAVLRTHPNDSKATSADYFMRNFRHLTIDAGNNPEIDGVRWFGNNSSILKDVRVVGNGRIGVHGGFVGQNGPNLLHDVEIEGFETGVQAHWMWGQTLSRVTIRNCRSNAVSVVANSVAIEDLVVENTPVAIRNDIPNDWTWWGGVVALVGGRFVSGDTGGAAIVNRSVLYARDVEARGWRRVIDSQTPGGPAAGPRVGEYLSHAPHRAFAESPDTSFRLPIRHAPTPPWESDPRRWICANDHGAVAGDNRDDTDAIQRAIDRAAEMGATTVFLRGVGGPDPNWYTLNGAVVLRGGVRRLIGFGFGRIVAGPEGRFIVDDRSAPVVEFRHLQAFGGRGAIYENRSADRAMVLESCDGTVLGAGSGDIFVTDCPAHVELRAPGQRLWARQINPEGTSDAGLLRNHGGRLWALGVKHEGEGVRLINDNGGWSEIFGVFNYGPGLKPDDQRPMFEIDHSPFCLMGIREIHFGGSSYPIKVAESRNGETRLIEGGGWIGWAMYSGWSPALTSGPPAVARPSIRPAGGPFIGEMLVEAASTTPGAAIRFTMDGTDPGDTSPMMSAPLRLDTSAELKVRAFAPGRPPSAARTAAFHRMVPREPDPPAPARPGLAFEYYEIAAPESPGSIPDFARLPPVAAGSSSGLDLAHRRRDQQFAVRFSGWFQAPADGIYTFHTISDDGSRLWIGDDLVVDNDGQHGDRERSGCVALRAGRHPIVVGYCQADGGMTLRVEVEGPALTRRPIPPSLLLHRPPMASGERDP